MKFKVGDLVRVKGGTGTVFKVIEISRGMVHLEDGKRSMWDIPENLILVRKR